MAGDILVGTSGFSYRHWRKGVFYPDGVPQAKELEYFAGEFRTVELNSPFYHLPSETTFAQWKRRTPRDFVFAVKASRFITHVKQLRGCEEPLTTLVMRARKLGGKLGPLLFQLPPSLELDLDRLSSFLRLLPKARRVVFEFRHESWFRDPVYALLEKQRVALCLAVGGRSASEPVVTAPFVYLRMHYGAGKDGNFTKRQLVSWAERLERWLAEGLDAYAYFNNDWGGLAVKNARALRDLLKVER
jgi:uncharacterized protein YecE (DUF72 family)